MHDPMVVAWEIRRPIPRRSSGGKRSGRRFAWEVHGKGWRRFLRPGNWSPFVTAFGRQWYFSPLVTIWHVEPNGRDSGTVCKHARREQLEDGAWKATFLNGWKWHVHHWRIQVLPLQSLRARLFDRCAECGRKGRPNISHQWDGKPLGWWKFKSREGLYHSECSSLHHSRRVAEERLKVLSLIMETGPLTKDDVQRLAELRDGSEGWNLAWRVMRDVDHKATADAR